jgi:uncharacterized protein DUF6438
MPFVCAVIALVIATVAPLAAAQIIPPDVVIRLERTFCFGECPVYSVSIDAMGNVTYDGTEFVRVKGRQTDRIPVPRVAELLATADRIGFFDLRDQYRTIRNPDRTETMVTDLPTTFVTITRGGRPHFAAAGPPWPVPVGPRSRRTSPPGAYVRRGRRS